MRGYKNMEKLLLSEKEYEYISKGIANGVGIGILIGLLLGDIILGFSSGRVAGIILTLIYSYLKK